MGTGPFSPGGSSTGEPPVPGENGPVPIFPPWSGTRVPLRRALAEGGRVGVRYSHGATRDLVEDESAVAEVEPADPRPGHGDQVACRVDPADPLPRVSELTILARARRPLAPEIRRAASQRETMHRRSRIVAAARACFEERGFLEVETPARVVNPGLEAHLRPFPAGQSGGGPRWLVTSPELHLKRLLAAGYERFFELARCFRDEERGRLHASEFLVLEWYRSHGGLPDLAEDLASLLPRCAAAAGLADARVRDCDLAAEPETMSFAEAFERHAGGDGHGLPPVERERVFALRVEPHLGRTRPTLIADWPADAAALSRLRPDAGGRLVAARMELFVAGIELANGFDELNDPDEQRRRHEADRAARAAAGAPVPALDEGFLGALEAGVPPAAGMALGMDRLVMLLAGKDEIGDVRLFCE